MSARRPSDAERPGTRLAAGLLLAIGPVVILAGLLFVPLLTAKGLVAYRNGVERVRTAERQSVLAADVTRAVLLLVEGEDADPAPIAAEFLASGEALRAELAALDRSGESPAPDADPRPPLESALASMRAMTEVGERLAATPRDDPDHRTLLLDLLELEAVTRRDSSEASRRLRQAAASRLARMLSFDAALIGLVLLGGFLQLTLVIRLHRLNAGLASEVRRRTESEDRLLENESALRTARDAAESASRAKTRFVAAMSHELRTPLNAILGYAWLAGEAAEQAGESRIAGDLGRIRAAGDHLRALIDDVLDLAKVESGMMELGLEATDLDALVRDTAETVRPLVESSGSTLETDVAPLGRGRTDPVRLRQILYNLLSNAAKFTEAGTVRLEARRDAADGTLTVAVADTGVGMRPEDLARAFEEFVQVDASETRAHGGTGLGLALVRRFTDLLGGRVEAESVPGEGSRFTVTVPAPTPTDDEEGAPE